jgi:cytoskeleton protein RodZ
MSRIIDPTYSDGAEARRRTQLREMPSEVPREGVGQELREERQRRGEDLTAASRVLRIRRDHLEALEEGRVDDLPGRTYAVGFVRSYAEYLGLDSAQYVERFKTEIAGRGEHSPLKGLPPESDGPGLPYGWLLMAAVLVAVVGYAGYQLVRSANLPSAQAVAPVPAAIAPQPARHVPPGRQARVQQSIPAPHPASVGAGSPLPTAGTAVQPTVPPASSAAANSALAALPPGQVFGMQNHNARVVLHVRTVTHVLVEGPGGRVYINRILHPGDAYRVPDLVGLSLTTEDGAAVSLELDGQDMGVAGRSGQMTEALSLDPQAIVDRSHSGNPH